MKFERTEAMKEKRRELDRKYSPRMKVHSEGRCAGMYGLCGQCWEWAYEEVLEWARKQPAPLESETPEKYWRRIEGPFYDVWHAVASEMMKAQKTEATR